MADRARSSCSIAAVLVLHLGCGAVAPARAEPAPQPATPETAKAPDARVEANLEAAGLAYKLDDGDYRLNYDLPNGRSQLVWVASGTATLDKLEIRDVWSVAYRAKGALPYEMSLRLLMENARMILGAWQVNQGTDEYLVVFSAPVSATADAATLQEVIEVVTLSADRIEKELTGKDEF
jgi:hypothetical protein